MDVKSVGQNIKEIREKENNTEKIKQNCQRAEKVP